MACPFSGRIKAVLAESSYSSGKYVLPSYIKSTIPIAPQWWIDWIEWNVDMVGPFNTATGV